jgi:hypothetical protein
LSAVVGGLATNARFSPCRSLALSDRLAGGSAAQHDNAYNHNWTGHDRRSIHSANLLSE